MYVILSRNDINEKSKNIKFSNDNLPTYENFTTRLQTFYEADFVAYVDDEIFIIKNRITGLTGVVTNDVFVSYLKEGI